jgi:hypothetical protein
MNFFWVTNGSVPALFGTLTAGYQYRSERGIVRPIVSEILVDGERHWWPGITLGVTF